MSASNPTPLYDQVVRVTHVYLGPAADRFIARQVENHLHKAPEELSKTDLASLIDWIRATVSLLTEDNEIIEEYAAELQKLAGIEPGS
jgi:plasmid maintenance system antidote protein VapI